MSNMKHEKAKRLAIYATFDKDGVVDDYILYCLNELYKVADDLAVVSNHELPCSEKNKLAMADWIYEREDSGYDMGGFAHVINNLVNEGRLEQYDEIIFLNDSVFGPFYPFGEMFLKMEERKELDFWGVTKRGISDFDGGDERYPEHIQLYFYVVRKKLAHSGDFLEYWRTVAGKVTDFRSAIINYEFAFTRYFSEKGYKWDVYCHTDDLVTEHPNLNLSPYHYCSYELIKEKKCPLLKRKLFTGDFIEGRFCDGNDLKKTISYLAEHTDYNMDLIWAHILRVYRIGDIMKSAKLLEIIDPDGESERHNPGGIRIIDRYGTVIKEKEKDAGRSEESAYTVFISLEKRADLPFPLFEAEKNCILENLLYDKTYVEKVVELFERKPRLGLVIPPVQTFGKISRSLRKEMPIHHISAFWCRSSLLHDDVWNDLMSDKTEAVMQRMPLLVQRMGYYTEIAVNRNYAAGLLINTWRTAQDIWEFTGDNQGEDGDLDIEEMYDRCCLHKIKDFVKGKSRVYVYGAGHLACRVIRMLEGIRKPDGIVVSDKNGNAESICGYPVWEAARISVAGSSFIVAVGKKNADAVKGRLEAAGAVDCLLFG